MIPRFAFAVLLLAALPMPVSADTGKPNVILIMADDVGHECFGAYGSTQYQTPNLDRLASAGLRFNHCYSQPLCTPSRVKLMTGQSNVRNYHSFGILMKDQKTFGHLMKSAGYATGVAGKWQLWGTQTKTPGKGMRPEEAGFDEFCLWQLTKRPERYWGPGLETNDGFTQHPESVYGPDVINDFALDFVTRHREAPFFLYYPMVLVHDPFPPTPFSKDKRSRDPQRNFEDMVFYMDHLVGRLDARLGELGLRDNTLLLFTADNGTNVRLSSTFQGREVKGAKGKMIHDGIHEPLIASWPSGIPAPRVLEDLVDFSDFLPTLAELAGVTPPQGVPLDGRSFLPQLRGEKGNPREAWFCYYNPRPKDAADRLGRRFACDGRWKLYGDGQLFDTRADILEKSPVPASEEPSGIRTKLQAVIDSMPAQGQSIGIPLAD